MSLSNPMHHPSGTTYSLLLKEKEDRRKAHLARFATEYTNQLEKEHITLANPLTNNSILKAENLFKLFNDTQYP